MATTAFQHHRHLAFVVQGVGGTRADQRFVVRGEAAVETREQRRIVRLRVGRFLGVVGVVQPHADDLARLAHQRQVIQLTDLNHRALGFLAMGGQIHSALQQRLQGFLAQHLDAFGSTHAQNGATLMVEIHITHGSEPLVVMATPVRQDGMGAKLIPRKYIVN
ncbi:hypothetical protein D3C84_768970 [compost metagenome]